MGGIGFAEQELGAGGEVDAGGLGEDGRVLADEIAVHAGVGAAAALAFLEGEGGLGELLELGRVQLHGAVLGEALHEFVGDAVEDEDFLFADAEEIVVEGGATDDGLGGAGGAAGVIHEHGRVAGAGADGALAGLHGGLDHHGSAGDEQEADKFVFAEGVEGIERGFLDDGGDVLDAGLAVDGFVIGAHGQGGAAGGAGVGVENDGVAGGGDVDDVAAEGGDGMGARGDGSDDAERGVFLEGDAMVAAAGIGAEPVHAGDELDDLELGDLVIEAADLGFVEFDLAPGFGILFGEGFDDLLDFAAGGDAFLLELEEGFLGGGAGFLGGGVDAELAAQGDIGGGGFFGAAAAIGGGRGGGGAGGGRSRRGGASEAAEDFGHHVTDQSFVHCAHKIFNRQFTRLTELRVSILVETTALTPALSPRRGGKRLQRLGPDGRPGWCLHRSFRFRLCR